VTPDVNESPEARAVAVLLHPHPQFGGDRFHPFVDGLFRRLPSLGITAARFDFISSDLEAARAEVLQAMEVALAQRPLPVVIVGYSFGAGVATGIGDDRVAGWYLLAPPASMLANAAIGSDPRPKAMAVPAHDQFSPPDVVREVVRGWTATTVTELPGADHFLAGAVDAAVSGALEWTTTVA
jgi:alpha/beta superfamily hydrolase